MTEKPTIFISYSWQTMDVANKIFNDFQIIGIPIIKDNQEISYTDSIPNFMKRIRSCNYALLLISDNYLKSKNCLFEILELQKDENHWDKILPIVWKETKIYSAIDRLTYIKYWEQKTKELESAIENVDPMYCGEIYKEIKLFKDIAYNIDSFLKKISECLHFTPEDIIEKNYEPIMRKLGVDYEPIALTELLKIILIKNLEHKEIALDEYIKIYPESGYYYSVKGATSKELNNFEKAIYYYEKGLEKDPYNFEILNNLGQIIEFRLKDYKRAKSLYERAIEANPNFDIPRINLAVLLKHHFNDNEGSKEQYLKILEFDPNNAKANNNISNFYKTHNPTEEDLQKAEFHLLKAIESNPLYIDALINYGNFLKVYRKEIQKGNEYYLKVREIDKENNLKELIDALIKSEKG
jgi:tetratricopeptide (TPR) repeat protein